jgi:hypothetical protein
MNATYSMDPDDAVEARGIVSAYMTVLERHYRANEQFPMPHSTLPHPKHLIRQSMRTMVGSLAAAGQITQELQDALEIAYTSLADYLDDELVKVMREYGDAMSNLDAEAGRGREKTGTAAWGRIAETSSLVARIARATADEAEALRAEFQQFTTRMAAEAPQRT